MAGAFFVGSSLQGQDGSVTGSFSFKNSAHSVEIALASDAPPPPERAPNTDIVTGEFMQGQVLGVDRASGEGQISGGDGLRYSFTQADWSDHRHPASGVRVDFEADGTRARKIFRLVEPGERAVVAAPENDRSKYVAALLAFFLGVLGIHRFYLGRIGSGIIMIVISITVIGLFVTSIWALIDMVRYLVMSDREFAARYPR